MQFRFFLPEWTEFAFVDRRGCEYVKETREVRCSYTSPEADTFGRPDIYLEQINDSVSQSSVTAYAYLNYTEGNTEYSSDIQNFNSKVIVDHLECAAVSNESLFKQKRKFKIEGFEDAREDQKRRRVRWKLADFEPTGFCVQAGKKFSIEVFGDLSDSENGEKAEVVVGTPGLVDIYSKRDDLSYDGNQSEARRYSLTKGVNTITDPLGGVVYIRYIDSAKSVEEFEISSIDRGPLIRFQGIIFLKPAAVSGRICLKARAVDSRKS